MTDHECDVVIATKNRPQPLTRCLEALTRQTVTNFRVIVVDDCSDVPLKAGIEASLFERLDLTVVTLDVPSGPAAARNAGADLASAEFILFVDDDIVADRRFVETHLAAVRQPHDPAAPIVSCGPFVQPADWDDPTPWNLWEARQAKKEADAMMNGVYAPTWRQFHTGNNCVPLAAFRAVGGFDADFKRAEDDEFALRLDAYGCVFHFEPAAIGWHYSFRTLEAWLSIPRSYAHFDVEIDKLHPTANYLEGKKDELQQRKAPLRVARRVFSGKRRTAIGVKTAVAAAKVLHRVGQTDLSMGALSVAYDLSYVQALSEADAEQASTEQR